MSNNNNNKKIKKKKKDFKIRLVEATSEEQSTKHLTWTQGVGTSEMSEPGQGQMSGG